MVSLEILWVINDSGSYCRIENHATIYAPELAGGIVGITNSSTGMTLQLFDCVNLGLISGDTSAKILDVVE